MKTPRLSRHAASPFIALTLGAIAFPTSAVQAGDQKEIKQVEAVKPADSWEFKLAIPGWLAAMSGTVGFKGVNTGVYLSPEEIIRHYDMVTSLSAEARKGRFGIYGDYLYISLSDGVGTEGLVSKVALSVNETISDLELNYRLLEGPQGWLDVRAGVRFTNVYSKTSLSPNDSAIDEASARFVDTASARLRDVLIVELRRVLDGQDPTIPVPPLAAGQKEKLLKVIEAARQDPELAAALKSGVQSRIDAAKNRVQNKISSALKKALDRSFSLNEYWFDPYVGLAARLNLNKAFYLTAKGDIGGFGAGSELTWQAYGGLGCQVTRRIDLELGYRYLYTDYSHDTFVYDVSLSGVQLTAGISF